MPVWGGTDKGHIQDLQVLQNRVAEIVLNLQDPNETRCMTHWNG